MSAADTLAAWLADRCMAKAAFQRKVPSISTRQWWRIWSGQAYPTIPQAAEIARLTDNAVTPDMWAGIDTKRKRK